MLLLVSVRNAEEALAAVAGGADIVDAKDPSRGAMGAVGGDVLAEIAAAVGGARPLSAALGDAPSPAEAGHRACVAARAGAAFVKIGLAGATAPTAQRVLDAAVRAAAGDAACGVVAVAYADHGHAGAPNVKTVVDVAAEAGAAGVLVDTANKCGPGLFGILAMEEVQALAARTHQAGLWFAAAGRLQAPDLELARRSGAEIAGVRGAVCLGGRTGRVSTERVAALRASLRRHQGSGSASESPAASVMATTT